ncbi:FAD synthase [Candidatus Woesearchaeota archaeon]|nr:FAD synthase [Candidatus Woesearchaeota archaeon]
MKKVLVFGTFDILHPGHLYFLREAKGRGDTLVAVVALDETVKQVKGKSPQNNQEQRMENLLKTGIVDKAVLGNPGDKHLIIEQLRPDVICLGYDQKFFTENLKENLAQRGINAEIIRIGSYYPEKYKSSKLKSS